MPLLPFIEDNWDNIGQIIKYAREAGARFIFPGFGVTLRENQRDWFYKELDKSFPGLRPDGIYKDSLHRTNHNLCFQISR